MHLHIRPFRPSDLDGLTRLLADPEVMRHLEPPYSPADTQAFLLQHGLSDSPAVFAVEDSSGLVGYVIYHPYDETAWELGWVLARSAWGKGYASALTSRLIEDARLRTKQLVIECAPSQLASKRIALRCGFAPLGQQDGLDVYRLDLHP